MTRLRARKEKQHPRVPGPRRDGRRKRWIFARGTRHSEKRRAADEGRKLSANYVSFVNETLRPERFRPLRPIPGLELKVKNFQGALSPPTIRPMIDTLFGGFEDFFFSLFQIFLRILNGFFISKISNDSLRYSVVLMFGATTLVTFCFRLFR